MVAFRIDRGGAAVIAAIVLIGLVDMAGNLRSGLLLGTLTVVSLLLHECGHMLAARILGVKVRQIGFCRKGSYIRRERAQAPLDEAAISLSGPMVNAMIAAVLWTVSGVWRWLAICNLVLLIVNLAPLPGSDGRRVYAACTQAAEEARMLVARVKKK